MPNTPALVGAGASAVCAGRWSTAGDLEVAEALLGAVGLVVRVEERQMDAVTALSGSGPAYVFYLMEAMLAAAEKMGLDPELARRLTGATVEGAARLARESEAGAGELRERVTSKGGTTAAALEVLRGAGVGEAWVEAILAAERRSKELSGT
jgi:pyrroline-5-carboxylate reductase